MPTWKSNVPDLTGLSLERQVEAIYNSLIEQDRWKSWFMSKLDSKNVKRLNTNETSIKSADGETVINGPVLEMYDKQAVPVLRLKQGYDSVSGDFIYALYNALGVQTVGIDSGGDATYTGTITGSDIVGGTIAIGSANNIFKANGTDGIWLGNTAFASAPFSVSLAGALAATSATITGGTLRTAASGARIQISGGKFETYNSSDALNGIAWGTGLGSLFGDVYFYDAGNLTMEIANIGSGGGWEIKPRTTGVLRIGLAGKTVEVVGTWDFDTQTPTITGLNAASAGTHNHGIPNGTVLAVDGGGTVTFSESGAHTHTVS